MKAFISKRQRLVRLLEAAPSGLTIDELMNSMWPALWPISGKRQLYNLVHVTNDTQLKDKGQKIGFNHEAGRYQLRSIHVSNPE